MPRPERWWPLLLLGPAAAGLAVLDIVSPVPYGEGLLPVVQAGSIVLIWSLGYLGVYFDATALARADSGWSPWWRGWVAATIVATPLVVAPLYLAVRGQQMGLHSDAFPLQRPEMGGLAIGASTLGPAAVAVTVVATPIYYASTRSGPVTANELLGALLVALLAAAVGVVLASRLSGRTSLARERVVVPSSRSEHVSVGVFCAGALVTMTAGVTADAGALWVWRAHGYLELVFLLPHWAGFALSAVPAGPVTELAAIWYLAILPGLMGVWVVAAPLGLSRLWDRAVNERLSPRRTTAVVFVLFVLAVGGVAGLNRGVPVGLTEERPANVSVPPEPNGSSPELDRQVARYAEARLQNELAHTPSRLDDPGGRRFDVADVRVNCTPHEVVHHTNATEVRLVCTGVRRLVGTWSVARREESIRYYVATERRYLVDTTGTRDVTTTNAWGAS